MTFEQFAEKGYSLTAAETRKLWKEIAAEYYAAQQSITRKLEATYTKLLSGVAPENYYNELLKYGRYDKLLQSITVEYDKAAKAAGVKQIASSKVSIANNFYRQQYVAVFGAGLDFFTVLPAEVIEISVYGSRKVWDSIPGRRKGSLEKLWGALINYQPKYGSLTDILTENRAKDIAKIKSIVTQGLINGSRVKDVAKDINKTFGISVSNAERIYRTESGRCRAMGDYANYQQLVNSGIDMWRKIISVLDNRTRPQSAEVDGEIDKDGTGFLYPNGQKYITPRNTGVAAYDINDREKVVTFPAGIDPVERRRGRDPVTGETSVFDYKTFKEWAKENGLKRNIYGQLLPV